VTSVGKVRCTDLSEKKRCRSKLTTARRPKLMKWPDPEKQSLGDKRAKLVVEKCQRLVERGNGIFLRGVKEKR